MRTVPATEAKAQLAQLLTDVERGETVSITRHGKVIARLVPEEDAEPAQARKRREAVQNFREHIANSPRVKASLEEILAWRHEGHKY